MEELVIAMASNVAKNTVSAIFAKVTQKTFEEIYDHLDVDDNFIDVRKKHKYILALMDDMRHGNHQQSHLVKTWFKDAREMICPAENLLDDYHYDTLRWNLECTKINHSNQRVVASRIKKFIKSLVPAKSWKYSTIVKQIKSGYEILYTDAKDVLQLATFIQPVPINSSAAGPSTLNENELRQIRNNATGAEEHNFIGMNQEQEKLSKQLVEARNEKGISIIAILGMGGFGKTSLAWRIYKEYKLKNKDPKYKRVWINVSKYSEIDALLEVSLQSLTSDSSKFDDDVSQKNKNKELDGEEFDGEKKLDEVVGGQELLLILDDVWERNGSLLKCLEERLQKIVERVKIIILITSRINNVATQLPSINVVKLEGLSEEDGWELLSKLAGVQNRSHESYKYYKKIGKEIVKDYCKGVPLAIKAMGAILQSKKSPSDWQDTVYGKDFSELIKQNKDDPTFPSLLLSYSHLPSVSAMQCFGYCAVFPKNTPLEKSVLINQWVAQGFLSEHGKDPIDDLVNHSLFEEKEYTDDDMGDIKWYKMHDLVHDLAVFVSEKDLQICQSHSELMRASAPVRHVAIDVKENDRKSKNTTAVEKPNIRTIYYWSGALKEDLISSAKYLRVLVASYMKLSEVPSVIVQLKHLRYLDLSHNEIKELPDSICILYQLQTLSLIGNPGFESLPAKLHRLECLIHIYVGANNTLSASRGIGMLTNLQTLPSLKLSNNDDKQGWSIDELENMDQLTGNLSIYDLQHVNETQAKQATLSSKSKISKLSLEWGLDTPITTEEEEEEEEVLKSLEPHPNVRELTVSGYKGKTLPSWIITRVDFMTIPYRSFTTVELSACENCQELPSLGLLPSLKTLKLSNFNNVHTIGKEFYGTTNNDTTNSFGALKQLHIEDFKNLITWETAKGDTQGRLFTSLEKLTISKCKKLNAVPDSSFESLKTLNLTGVGKTTAEKTIKKYPSLIDFMVSDISGLEILPVEWLQCSQLKKVIIKKCNDLKSLHNGQTDQVMMANSLNILHIEDCQNLESIPTSFGNYWRSLESIKIKNCPSNSDGFSNLSNMEKLVDLELINCGSMLQSVQAIQGLPRLERLTIGGFSNVCDFSCPERDRKTSSNSLKRVTLQNFPGATLPDQVQNLLPSSLEFLEITDSPSLRQLPEWIWNLQSLRKLNLMRCAQLQRTSSERIRPTVSDCPNWEKTTSARNDGICTNI